MRSIGLAVAAFLALPIAVSAAEPAPPTGQPMDGVWRVDAGADEPTLLATENVTGGAGQVGFLLQCGSQPREVYLLTIGRTTGALTPAQAEAARTSVRGFTLLPVGAVADDYIVTIVSDGASRNNGGFLTAAGNVPRGRLRTLVAGGRGVWAWVNAGEAYSRPLGESFDLPLAGLTEGLDQLDALCIHRPLPAPPSIPVERAPPR